MKLKKIRNALLVVLSLALVSAATVAITLAASTETSLTAKENTFTNNPSINVSLREPLFDGITNWSTDRIGDSTSDIPAADADLSDGTGDNAFTFPAGFTKGSDLGYYKARAYTAGASIPKNPMLKNTSNPTFVAANNKNSVTSDEWVAIGLKYTLVVPSGACRADSSKNVNIGDGSSATNAMGVAAITNGSTHANYGGATITFETYDDFAATIASVKSGASAGFSSSWTDISSTVDAKVLFGYNSKLAKGEVTPALFDSVEIKTPIGSLYVNDGTNVKQYYPITIMNGKVGTDDTKINETIYLNNLPEFKIQLKGYAVQGDNLATLSAAQSALQALAAKAG